MSLIVRDCSPFDTKLSQADMAWLGRLAVATRQGDLVVRLEEGREAEPVVSCDPDGKWRAGRYIGSIQFEGRKLEIRPRFGEKTLRSWFSGAFNIAIVETRGELVENDWFVPWLLASVWTHTFVLAARHGLPSLRKDFLDSGLTIRGRLDIPNTVLLRATGIPGVASVRREKSLDNPIAAAIVAAYTVLARQLGSGRESEWLPDRIKELMPHLIAAVGQRPRIPSMTDIDNVRLTPITAGFRSLAELSIRIARERGLASGDSEAGQCKGVLLDVAELWELYVLAAIKRSWPDMDVTHGTHAATHQSLLYNDKGNHLGKLMPDALILRGTRTAGIFDAKYKRLTPTAWSVPPEREDMYQLAAYMARYGDQRHLTHGVLAYPQESDEATLPSAEVNGPWKLDDLSEIRFITLPHKIDDAVCKLRQSLPMA